MNLGPPPTLPPEQLFRSLMRWRPQQEIEISLAGAVRHLRVQAITALEELRVMDLARLTPPEIRDHRYVCGLVAATVREGTELAFESPEAVADLYEDEIERLGTATMAALNQMCPTYVRSDWREWKRLLELGVRHPSNNHVAYMLALCFDPVAMSERIVPHPERYWDCGVGELLDGHLLCYRAARVIYG